MVAVSAQLRRLNQSGVQDWLLARKLKSLRPRFRMSEARSNLATQKTRQSTGNLIFEG